METTWRCRCLSHRLGWCSFFKSATQAWEASTAWASSAFASALVFSAFPCLACLSKASIVLFRRASKKGPFSFYNRRNSSSSSTGLLVHVVLFSHLFFSISSFFHTDEEVIAPKSILKFRNLFCRHALKTFNFVTPTSWPLPPTKNTSLLSNYLLTKLMLRQKMTSNLTVVIGCEMINFVKEKSRTGGNWKSAAIEQEVWCNKSSSLSFFNNRSVITLRRNGGSGIGSRRWDWSRGSLVVAS